MTLLKLIYIAHGWFLEIRDAPLIRDRIEAWKYGPVIPTAYNAFRPQGVHVSAPVPGVSEKINSRDEQILEQIYQIYGGMSPFRLSELTHERNGPWDLVSRVGGHFAEIPNDLIREHYVQKRKKAESAAS